MPLATSYDVDPELAPALASFPSMELTPEVLPMLRQAGLEAAKKAPVPSDVAATFEEVLVPGPAGPVPVLVVKPSASSAVTGAILHMHGGGYLIGTPYSSLAKHVRLAVELNCSIFSVDYRLSPETPFPGAIEDCYAVLAWMNANASALGIDVKRIAVAGDSAGGGLAASLALMARDRREFSFCFQNLVYPMLDDRSVLRDDGGDFLVWSRARNRFGWSSLLGAAPGQGDVSPYAAAARATDLSGLPPAIITVGALDLFAQENIDYASRLLSAGVPVELHVYPRAYHGFMLVESAGVQRRADAAIRDALRAALRP